MKTKCRGNVTRSRCLERLLKKKGELFSPGEGEEGQEQGGERRRKAGGVIQKQLAVQRNTAFVRRGEETRSAEARTGKKKGETRTETQDARLKKNVSSRGIGERAIPFHSEGQDRDLNPKG